MSQSPDDPIQIQTSKPVRPTCPRCGSEFILIGRLTDDRGVDVCFAAIGRHGEADPTGAVRSCYCNDCGEITLTLA